MFGSNFTDSREKDVCRAHNIDALRGARTLVDPHTFHAPLRCDWLELAGVGAPTASVLHNTRRLSERGRFIGIDIEPKVVSALRSENRPHCEFYEGEFAKLVTRERRLFGRVGVLNLDTTYGWQGDVVPPIVEDCTVATEFILSRLNPPSSSGEKPAREFLFIVNGLARQLSQVLPTIDRALAPLRAACRSLGMGYRAAKVAPYPSRGRTTEMINLAIAIGY